MRSLQLKKYFGFRLSPDERQLAIDCCADSNSREIWLRDLVLGSLTRLTFGGASAPVWSPDGRVIVFSDPGTDRLYRQSSDGTGRRLALADGAEAALDFSPDGLILFQKRGEGLWVEPATGGVSSALVQSPFKEKDARFIVERNLSFRKKGFDDLGSLRPSKMKATRIAECSSKHRLTF